MEKQLLVTAAPSLPLAMLHRTPVTGWGQGKARGSPVISKKLHGRAMLDQSSGAACRRLWAGAGMPMGRGDEEAARAIQGHILMTCLLRGRRERLVAKALGWDPGDLAKFLAVPQPPWMTSGKSINLGSLVPIYTAGFNPSFLPSVACLVCSDREPCGQVLCHVTGWVPLGAHHCPHSGGTYLKHIITK